MVDELVHGDVGPELSETEYDSLTAHILNNQVRGDLIISNTAATGLVRLALGTTGLPLIAGANDPQWGGAPLILDDDLHFGADIVLSRGAANRLEFADGDQLRLFGGAGSPIITLRTGVEVDNRLELRRSGLFLGDGTNPVDVSLTRGAANRLDLASGDSLRVGGQTIADSSGDLASANGVGSFGPSAVTSITIVNGIVTAIS